MSISPEVRSAAEAALLEFCREHSSAPGADPLRYSYEVEANAAVLYEQKPGFLNDAAWQSKPLARFRYSEARDTWSLYWSDAAAKWHRVSDVKPEKDLRSLLRVVLEDPLGVFWS